MSLKPSLKKQIKGLEQGIVGKMRERSDSFRSLSLFNNFTHPPQSQMFPAAAPTYEDAVLEKCLKLRKGHADDHTSLLPLKHQIFTLKCVKFYRIQ